MLQKTKGLLKKIWQSAVHDVCYGTSKVDLAATSAVVLVLGMKMNLLYPNGMALEDKAVFGFCFAVLLPLTIAKAAKVFDIKALIPEEPKETHNPLGPC